MKIQAVFLWLMAIPCAIVGGHQFKEDYNKDTLIHYVVISHNTTI
jgi:Na+-transporting NADH:ubiquinone oxidoreductase subunit NqrE